MTSSSSPATHQIAEARKLFRRTLKGALDKSDVALVRSAVGGARVFPRWVTWQLALQAAQQKDPAIVRAVLGANRAGGVPPRALKALLDAGDERDILAVAKTGTPGAAEFLIRHTGQTDNVGLMTQLVDSLRGEFPALDHALVLAMTEAGSGGHWGMLRYLMGVVPSQETQRQSGALLYCLVDSSAAPADLVEQLLATGEGDRAEWCESLMISAAQHGCATFIGFLMDTPGVRKQRIAQAVVSAAWQNLHEVLEFMVPRVAVDDLTDEFSRQMKDLAACGPSGDPGLRALNVALDGVGRVLKSDDVAIWMKRYPIELLPLTCARWRAMRAEAVAVAETVGAAQNGLRRARARP